MIPRLGQALESLFGPSLGSVAVTLARAAAIALGAAVTIALVRAAVALAARRHGWERAWIVRCPACGRLVADPRQPSCPLGHRISFPPGSARAAQGRGRRARMAALYSILLSLAVAGAAFAVYLWLGLGGPATPLSRVCAASAYFFFLIALYAADFALSARPRGAGARLLHGLLALACLTPFLALFFLSRALEPASGRIEGKLWATPAGVYVQDGRARRLGPTATAVEARMVEARLPALEISWQGLTRFRLGALEQPWRGRGGTFARFLDRSAETLRGRGILVRRFSEEVPLPPNLKVRIVRRAEGFRFEPETGETR